jgi:glutamyl/glutaminyl-tRNA synthetase
VAASFEMGQRMSGLSWTHHRVVATLDPEERACLLSRAEEDCQSVADLKAAVAGLREVRASDADEDCEEEAVEEDAEESVSNAYIEATVRKIEDRAVIDDRIEEVVAAADTQSQKQLVKQLLSALKEDVKIRNKQIEKLENLLAA